MPKILPPSPNLMGDKINKERPLMVGGRDIAPQLCASGSDRRLCHLRIGILEWYVTLEISKMAYTEWCFRHFMHNYAIECNEIINFHKNRRIFTKIRKFLKVPASAAPKMCHFSNSSHFSPFSVFRRLWHRKMCHFRAEDNPSLGGSPLIIRSLLGTVKSE